MLPQSRVLLLLMHALRCVQDAAEQLRLTQQLCAPWPPRMRRF
jgi:hypothetical protein